MSGLLFLLLGIIIGLVAAVPLGIYLLNRSMGGLRLPW